MDILSMTHMYSYVLSNYMYSLFITIALNYLHKAVYIM